MGRTPLFLGGPIPFEGLLALGKSPKDPIELKTCKNGTETTHKASLTWRTEYKPGIDKVVEPLYSPGSTEFEVFSGITLMQMTENHIVSLMSKGAPVTLGRWLLPEFQLHPHLIITHIQPNTYASHILARGMVISKLNGHNISTLKDFRDHFSPQDTAWELETDRGLLYTVNFRDEVKKQLAASARVESNRYLMTKTLTEALEKLGMSKQEGAATNLLKVSISKDNTTEAIRIISRPGTGLANGPKATNSQLGVIEPHLTSGPASLAEEAATAAAQATAAARNLARKADADEKTTDSASTSNMLALGQTGH